MSKRVASVIGTAMMAISLAPPSAGQMYEDNLSTDHPAIAYWQAPLDDPVARLSRELDAGTRKLDVHGDGLSYLPSLLEHLGVSSNSQVLVFSKTSLQESRISPRTPRAIYFGDDVAIGFSPGSGVIEVAAIDPRQGVVFYVLETQNVGPPRFARPRGCLRCHHGPATLGVPGMYVGSVYASPSGRADFRDSIVTDHRTPLADRWGGWYVTGTHGEQRHRGNAVSIDPADPEVIETEGTQNLTTLARKFDATGYLTPLSDIVALMTLEHQTQMTNLLSRLAWESRIAEHDDAADMPLDARVDELVRYILFADEIPLREPLQGVSAFTKTFPERGPRDRQSRSLRDFDLQKRLFRHPLSYMVYSESFDALPDTVRDQVYRRLYDVLTGKDRDDRFARLSGEDRNAILDILRDTKSNLPAYWSPAPRRRTLRHN